VHQFLVVLANSDPLVWRRIQVPEHYSFWDLHVAIQDAMGWADYHPHEFRVVVDSAHNFLLSFSRTRSRDSFSLPAAANRAISLGIVKVLLVGTRRVPFFSTISSRAVATAPG